MRLSLLFLLVVFLFLLCLILASLSSYSNPFSWLISLFSVPYLPSYAFLTSSPTPYLDLSPVVFLLKNSDWGMGSAK
jgi:hypothetical protein